MRLSTIEKLRCPKQAARRRPGRNSLVGQTSCLGELSLAGSAKSADPRGEVSSGELRCRNCGSKFPILAGVAILVDDVHAYLIHHVKGISRLVRDAEIPREHIRDYLEAKAELQAEHIEEDLEAERVVALYLLNHYLRATSDTRPAWWRPLAGEGSPLIDSLIRAHWDQGPFAQLKTWMKSETRAHLVELGCGVGGLFGAIGESLGSYLGVDSSFASIALARHLSLGAPYPRPIRVPKDLLQGPASVEIRIPALQIRTPGDFVVGDLESLPVARGQWDYSIALNAIDMLEEPVILPEIQRDLLRPGGQVVQGCPYIWHETVAKRLRKVLPREIQDSARAVEWLYKQKGFAIEESVEHVPWLFFKHVRQLEIYSVHLFRAKLGAQS